MLEEYLKWLQDRQKLFANVNLWNFSAAHQSCVTGNQLIPQYNFTSGFVTTRYNISLSDAQKLKNAFFCKTIVST